jgi:hypothetical protein
MQQPVIELCKVRAYPVITVSPDREPRLENWKPRVFNVQMDLGTFLFVLFSGCRQTAWRWLRFYDPQRESRQAAVLY